jgi:acyl-CoA synthetase (AMP-forming)/AMP-acid ligase II
MRRGAVLSLIELLRRQPAESVAILGAERSPLRFGALAELAGRTIAALNARGIGRQDRVAILLPNGPEMASAFLALATGTGTAPLNPAYRADELDFYLKDLEPKALVLQAGSETPAREAARKLGIAVIELVPDAATAGQFRLDTAPGRAAPDFAGSGDTALLLHTSGTTSRPKLVPLSHGNILASAANVGAVLDLSAADRCLNIMPLFHIHGLIAAVLASVAAGGSVYCTPGFNALKFFAWLEEVAPTWYTAVPTMHQAILARAGRNREVLARRKLRFIRSSSASLPAPVMTELEAAFGCPVIESYGMTEAAHQMTSNPLPPAARKPGSVGRAAGPEVAVMDENGRLLPAGARGEVAIRGANVTAGYVANPSANAAAFADGWFRTGDQGVFDAEGYLTITGRLKELINRGGEKISPLEVDAVLLSHPAVAQAVTFALPHDKLGEDVAAAIVLREGARLSDRELRDFAAARLADFKVPRRVLFLDEIPKGATGKLQRMGLAAKLGLSA